MFDYSHAKVVADKGAVVSVSGRRDGTAIGPTDKVGNTFQVMEFTDGLNEFFFGAQYRWPHERWTPYVGFGVGPSVRHVEVRRPGVGQPYTFEYQLAGVEVEGLVGIEYRFGPHVSAFADYKLSFAINDTDLKGGGSLDTIYGRTTSFLASPTGSGLRRVRPIRRLRPAPRRSGSVKWSSQSCGECPYWDKRKRLI
jgi:hypothetical protein